MEYEVNIDFRVADKHTYTNWMFTGDWENRRPTPEDAGGLGCLIRSFATLGA